jgi:NAD(P)-dependent dehydrogenase (short-subunit alcohol dehydrogenase family)
MTLEGKAAFVSGGSSGIGRAISIALADRGAGVVVADIDLEGTSLTVDEIEARGGRAVPQRCDVTSSVDLRAAFDRAVDEFGRLDIVCNNAGIGGDNAWLTDDASDWRRVVDVDLVAVIDATRLAIHALGVGGGVIVNTSSLIGLYPMAAAPIYGAAKAGVIAFTRSLGSLAEERRIRINAICPELVDTPLAERGMGTEAMNELRESDSVLTPAQIAEVVIDVITDTSKAGEIIQVTASDGAQWVDLSPRT